MTASHGSDEEVSFVETAILAYERRVNGDKQMLWECMRRRWLERRHGETEDVADEDKVDSRELCEQQVANTARYAEMRAYLSYPS
jgi:hypothetical protein